ncbi:MAG: ATP synthase F1 subunit epsilon [Candidatus Komeilibacteria bacterium]|nr:ATP synthase F1 subunit epsilon [Candidatus Komeilibacteria bacterium]
MSLTGFTFKIVTPERVVFESQVSQATLPTRMGEITVLPNHIPLVSSVIPGEIRIVDEQGREHLLAVAGGFVQVYPGKIVILADRSEMAHELDEARAAEAHERARKLLEAKTGMPDRDYAALKALMDKELARLKVARKYKERGIRTGDLK